MKQKNCPINFNHISENLSNEDELTLKSYYYTYHRKCWCYKYLLKKLKRIKLASQIASATFGATGIISAIATQGVFLVAISVIGVIIESYKSYKNLDTKIYFCDFSYKEYQHLLNEIKEMLRIGEFDNDYLVDKMKHIDDIVCDHAMPIDGIYKKYDNKYSCGFT